MWTAVASHPAGLVAKLFAARGVLPPQRVPIPTPRPPRPLVAVCLQSLLPSPLPSMRQVLELPATLIIDPVTGGLLWGMVGCLSAPTWLRLWLQQGSQQQPHQQRLPMPLPLPRLLACRSTHLTHLPTPQARPCGSAPPSLTPSGALRALCCTVLHLLRLL